MINGKQLEFYERENVPDEETQSFIDEEIEHAPKAPQGSMVDGDGGLTYPVSWGRIVSLLLVAVVILAYSFITLGRLGGV